MLAILVSVMWHLTVAVWSFDWDKEGLVASIVLRQDRIPVPTDADSDSPL